MPQHLCLDLPLPARTKTVRLRLVRTEWCGLVYSPYQNGAG